MLNASLDDYLGRLLGTPSDVAVPLGKHSVSVDNPRAGLPAA